MEQFPVESVIERSIANQVNALIGNDDVNLKTIVKMAMMVDKNIHSDIEYLMNGVLNQIKRANKMEHELVQEEYEIETEWAGEKISLYNKPDDEGEETKEDSGCFLPK